MGTETQTTRRVVKDRHRQLVHVMEDFLRQALDPANFGSAGPPPASQLAVASVRVAGLLLAHFVYIMLISVN